MLVFRGLGLAGFFLALLGFQFLPGQFLAVLVGLGLAAAEDMGMAADHLGGDGPDHIAEIEQAQFLGHAGVKHDLEQEIAQFVRQRLVIAILDAGRDFVSFLDGVRRDGGEGLGAVPGTAAGRAQPAHDLEQLGDVAAGPERIGLWGIRHGEGLEGAGLSAASLSRGGNPILV